MGRAPEIAGDRHDLFLRVMSEVLDVRTDGGDWRPDFCIYRRDFIEVDVLFWRVNKDAVFVAADDAAAGLIQHTVE